MTNDIKVFDNEEFGKVRTTMINGEPWFVASDICDALDITNSRDAINRLDDDEKGVVLTDTLGGVQNLNTVNEAGLYTLVLGSRKPAAKKFKRWITHEVIPSIRKTGGYVANDELFISTYLPTADEATKLMFRTTLATVRQLNKESKLFLSKCFYYKPYEFEFSIGIAFKDNIHDWNDFDNILVLDEDFGQSYTPFYGDMFGKDVYNFPTLEFVIEKYNEYMNSLGIFEGI